MKSIFASLIVPLFGSPVLRKDGHCAFRVHVVADGRIYVASGLNKADIEALKKCGRLIGENKKR